MTQHDFDILTEKYLAGDCSPEEISLLEKWVEMHSNLQGDANLFGNPSEAQLLQDRLWQSIRVAAKLQKLPVFSLPYWKWMGIAASLVIGMVYYFTSNSISRQANELTIHGIETKNKARSRQKVVLSDGSTVILEKNSTIITAEGYGKESRTVYLTGEAFFEIKRNDKVPFLVHAGDLVTEVLGTSFYIKPRAERKLIEVSVKTGRVSVYANESAQNRRFNGVIITPNQKVLYDTEHKTLRQDIVESPQVLVSRASSLNLNFKETTIDSVLFTIQKAYGVDIVVANPVLNQCSFTGDLDGITMYKQLAFICGVINAHYEIRGTTIFINGKGCQSPD